MATRGKVPAGTTSAPSGRAARAPAAGAAKRPATGSPASRKDTPRTMRDLREATDTKRRAQPVRPVENPLREGLRLERVPDPAAFVLFGATGDLAHRKVVPALFQLWRTHLLPHELSIVAIGRRPYTDEAFRAELKDSLDRYSRVQPVDRETWDDLASRIVYHRGDFADPALYEGLARAAGRVGRGVRHPRQPDLLPGHPAVGIRRDHRRSRTRGAGPRAPRGRLAPGRHREAVRPRHQLRDPPQPRGGQGLPRAAGLPHRPLPGQGDRAEPPGLPVRQRDLRADLEPAAHRPCADHRRRVDRHREPRRLLRGDGREPGLPPEPPAPAPEPGRDGAAGDLRGRRAARREGQGDPRDPGAHPRAGPTGRGPWPIRSRVGVGQASQGVPRRGRRRPGQRNRDVCRRPVLHRQLALVGRPVLPADGQAAAQAGDRDRDPVQGRPPPAVQGQRDGPRAQPDRDADPARRGDHAPLRGQGPGLWASTSAT